MLQNAPLPPAPAPTAPVTAFRLPVAAPGARAAERSGRVAVAVTGVLWVAAVAVLAASLAGVPFSVGTLRVAGRAVTGWRADRLAAILGLLVTTVALVATSFATRYLRGDARATRFFLLVPATALATLGMVGATTLVGFAVGWTLSELGVLGLVGLHRPEPGAVAAHRLTRRTFLAGDLALWAAVVVVLVGWGNLDLHRALARPPVLAGHGPALVLLALLVPVAVAARCALAPCSRWLPASLAAPTPVSAFLHAGLVNAGGVLLVRLAPLTGRSHLGQALVFALGAASVVVAGAAAVAEPSVKGSLVRSTSAQMGFMVACCGLGWYLAAVLHLVAHGLYKSTLFLGSGGAVAQRAAAHRAPPGAGGSPALRTAASLVVPAVAVGWVFAHLAAGPARTQLLGVAVLGWATAALLARGWLGRLTSVGAATLVVVGVSVVAGGYLLVARSLGTLLAPSVVAIPSGSVPPAVGLAVVALLGGADLVWRSGRAAGHPIGRRAWALAAGTGRPRLLRDPATTARPSPVRSDVPVPVGVAA